MPFLQAAEVEGINKVVKKGAIGNGNSKHLQLFRQIIDKARVEGYMGIKKTRFLNIFFLPPGAQV